jgi:hypothetical protein
VWQQSLLETGALRAQEAYWNSELSAIVRPDVLPAGREFCFHYWRQTTILPKPLIDALRSLAARENATLFMVLATGLLILLRRSYSSDQLSLGTLAANRSQHGTDGLIGLFVNTLVLCVDAQSDLAAKDLLQRVRHQTLAAFSNEDVPFEHLLSRIRERDQRLAPRFRALLVLQNFPSEEDRETRLPFRLDPIHCDRGDRVIVASDIDLILDLEERQDGVTAVLRTNVASIGRDQTFQFLSEWGQILERLPACLDKSISSIGKASENAYLNSHHHR